jgi:hypothetical protein
MPLVWLTPKVTATPIDPRNLKYPKSIIFNICPNQGYGYHILSKPIHPYHYQF